MPSRPLIEANPFPPLPHEDRGAELFGLFLALVSGGIVGFCAGALTVARMSGWW
jgi:hypothetical protein